MALLLSQHFVELPSSYKLISSPFSFVPASFGVQSVRFRRFSSFVRSRSVTATGVGSPLERTNGTAILWYKHDLRIDDHPGLLAASRHSKMLPLYIFDRRILSRFSDELLELLLIGLDDLRKSLKDQGSNLMIRFGSAESVIEELVKEVKATSIYTEEEIEYDLRGIIDAVKEISSTSSSAKIVVWSNPFYDLKDLGDVPVSYNDFKKLKLPVLYPISPPQLPGPETEMAWGDLPALDALQDFLADSNVASKRKWALFEDVLVGLSTGDSESMTATSRIVRSGKNNIRKRPENTAFVTRQGYSVGGGTSGVLDALAAYLRYLEGTARSEWQEVHEKLREFEIREGASFRFLFGSALLLGIISRRRVHYEAIKYEKERNAGFLSPFGYSVKTVAAAIETSCSSEWYWLLALKSQRVPEERFSIRLWRWNGFLIQYTAIGHEGSPVLLVHGFGAFFEHYRDNIRSIAEGGNRVWAITLLGFGRSEKPNVIYTELMWAKLVRDFIIEVIKEPVHLVGNSIGGYIVAIVSKLWPSLVKSAILLNSAGNVIPEYNAANKFSESRQISGASWLGARLLLPYLRSNLKNIVKNFYPSKTDRVDDMLINEMSRASHDPGVVMLLECIFSFDLSVPLNYLLDGFESKVLVIQGVRDPLTDSSSKLKMLRECSKGISFREIDAGHCPHDEVPFEINSIIQDWIVSVEREAAYSVSSTP